MRTVVEAEDRATVPWRDEVADIGRHVGIPVAVAIVILTAITAVAGLLIEREPAGGVGALDLRIAEDLVARRTPTIDDLTGVAVLFANTVPVAIVWVGAMVVAAVVTRRWTIPVFLLVAVGGEKLTYFLAGLIVGRSRPPVEPLGEVFATSSFPSGHAGAAVALYGGIAVAVAWYLGERTGARVGPTVRAVLAVAVAALAVVVAFSRVWRGQHYLSDVVWGAALGLAWLALAWWLVLRPATADGATDRTTDGEGSGPPKGGVRPRSW